MEFVFDRQQIENNNVTDALLNKIAVLEGASVWRLAGISILDG